MNSKAKQNGAAQAKTPQGPGAPQNQIATLTQRIKHLTEHLKQHRKDHSSKRGLMNLVSKRSKIILYLKRTHPVVYLQTRKELGFRK